MITNRTDMVLTPKQNHNDPARYPEYSLIQHELKILNRTLRGDFGARNKIQCMLNAGETGMVHAVVWHELRRTPRNAMTRVARELANDGQIHTTVAFSELGKTLEFLRGVNSGLAQLVEERNARPAEQQSA